MPTLTIEDFACVKWARIEVAPITVIIGPQASGKSIISKLLYFFNDLILNQYTYAERGESAKPFLKGAAKRFGTLFPPNAWGTSRFSITYRAGDIELTVKRRLSGSKLMNEATFEASGFFLKQYTELYTGFSRLSKKSKEDDDLFVSGFSDDSWELRRSSIRALIKALKGEYIESQLFIPAGRSFFTNLGKAVAMFEFGSQLDDLTKRFGRLFTHLLDGNTRYYLSEKTPAKAKEFFKYQKAAMESIVGGSIKLAANDKYIETKDGRNIPLALLSSGQQELLPLLLVLQNYTRVNAMDRDPSVDLLYIEEPEAHLFPSAQSALIEHLAAVANFLRPRSRLFITTHSPYVLSTLNNLIKAHAVASHLPKTQAEIGKIIPKESWISAESVQAYALDSGIVRPINEDSGLIDGSYLDEISNNISSNFMELLELELTDD